MIKIIPADKRHYSDFGWLKTYWLFSFSDYYDPENIQFGALRVFNDDIIEPKTGFPTHPHHEMEIITIVLDGEITHQDSMGNKGVIKAGEVQRMSAGTGLTHSEYNYADKPLRLYQVWIYPDKRGLKPTYDQKTYDPSHWRNRLYPVASGQGFDNTVTFHTDATIYRADLDKDHEIEFSMDDTRRILVYVTDGELMINGKRLKRKDQARIDMEKSLKLKAIDKTGLIFIDVPSCKGFGYDQKTLKGEKK